MFEGFLRKILVHIKYLRLHLLLHQHLHQRQCQLLLSPLPTQVSILVGWLRAIPLLVSPLGADR